MRGMWLSSSLYYQGLSFHASQVQNDPTIWDTPSRGVLPDSVDENESSWTHSVVPAGKGVAIPSSGECPEPFSDMAFIRVWKCRGIQHMCIAYQSMSNKAIVIKN